MNNLISKQVHNHVEDEIDLRELFNAIWEKKFYIAAIASIFFLISVVYALMLPNIYRSVAFLAPVEGESQMAGMLGEYSGMANLAGIALPSSSATKSQEAIARIQSFDFFSNHFLPSIQLEDLLAVTKWNRAGNNLVYDKSEFDPESRQWVRKVSLPKLTIPSSQEAYEKYQEILSISVDKKTTYVSLSVEHESPYIAQQWVELILHKIDRLMRDKEKLEATKSIEYLNTLAPTINYEGLKKAFSSLQQEQMKRLMMVEANENYIFKFLDSPIVPEKKFGPRRILIVIIASLIGIMLGVFSVLALPFFRKPSKQNEPSSL
jgi:LPS O-antigen subunit length determinant protein (WzzB/FepE family)